MTSWFRQNLLTRWLILLSSTIKMWMSWVGMRVSLSDDKVCTEPWLTLAFLASDAVCGSMTGLVAVGAEKLVCRLFGSSTQRLALM